MSNELISVELKIPAKGFFSTFLHYIDMYVFSSFNGCIDG